MTKLCCQSCPAFCRRAHRFTWRIRRKPTYATSSGSQRRLVQLGFAPCPHIAAREVHSEASLRASFNQMRESGITQILLIAGDRKDPAGPYTSAVEILESGLTVDAAIKTISVAGHPEGNRTIGPTRLKEALQIKQAFADRTGTDRQARRLSSDSTHKRWSTGCGNSAGRAFGCRSTWVSRDRRRFRSSSASLPGAESVLP